MSPFQEKVFREARKIPLGETRTYAQIARAAGRPGAARAVGNALNKNRLPLIIPCHRVVKSSGETGGYAFGSSMKKMLLFLESAFSKVLR